MYLLDTCLFSELIKKEPSKKVIKWIFGKDEKLFFVSALTFGEIKKGIEKVTDTSRKKKLEMWMQEYLFPRFKDRLLDVDLPVAMAWGNIVANSEKKGRVIPTIDSLLAATAITHNLHLVTRNVKDFTDLNLVIINPWE